jgi:predicted nuclease of predicted toxin-antitoxin system
MLLLVADENFNNDILRGLLRRDSSLDIVRIQDVGLVKAPDPDVLEWAAQENRVLLTHDRNTIPKFAYDRVAQGRQMPGVIEVDRSVSMNVAIEDILLLAVLSESGELEGQIIYLPLR